MTISTNLNIAPYFDDYDPTKQYYKILFKPGTSVQTRELNQIQTMFQTQIERFGDNVLKRGTIVDGCNFIFNNAQSYVKIVDNETDGTPVIPSLYVGNFVRNTANLQGFIVNFADGFESTDPDLKTIYVNYRNSGDDGLTSAFTPGEKLTIFDGKRSVYKVNVIDGGSNFSNNDTVIFSPQLAIETSSGVFNPGDFIVDTAIGAVTNVEIVSIDNVTLSSIGYSLVKVKPRVDDLYSATSNSSFWDFGLNSIIQTSSGSASGTVRVIYGRDAQARIRTLSSGQISQVTLLNRGMDYDYTPYVSVKSIDNSLYVNTIDLQAINYIAEVKAGAASDAIGRGYTFSVSEGIVYQKGFFQRVEPQTVLVSKYDTFPNNLVVGFNTSESIINSNEDTSLLDNALGSQNETAPGADRLKLTPELTVVDKDVAAANAEFFSIVEFNEGNPYKQNNLTVYNRVGDEIARSNFESSGNYVLDSFQVTTEYTTNSANEGLFYSVVVDPGQAYISGYKVQTLSNFKFDIKKGLDTRVANNTRITLNYGNYLRIKEVGGNFLFHVGADVQLYSLPKTFLSNTSLIEAGNTTPQGINIGSAKMRSLVLENDVPGTPNSIYRLYLFDIRMNSGRNIKDVKSVFYNGTFKGIGDVVLDFDSTTSAFIAQLKGIKEDGLLFPAGIESLKNSNNTSYTYRTVDASVGIANNGILIKSIASNQNEIFNKEGELSSGELKTLYVVPVGNDAIQYTPLTGTAAVQSTSTTITGSGTSFLSDFIAGDYVYIYSTISDNAIKRVSQVISDTQIIIDSNTAFTNAASIVKRAFPKNVPIPFGYRDGLTANVDSTLKVLTLNFAHANGTQLTFDSSVFIDTSLAFNVNRENVESSTKTSNRSRFVKIRVANNTGGVNGPWALGVPDVFRLRNIYIANSSAVNTSSFEIGSKFYVDHNQKTNYLGMSYLYKSPRGNLTLTSDDFLLVEMDYFTNDNAGYFDAKSYRRTSSAQSIAVLDAQPLSMLSSSAASLEIPEVYTFDGQTYDLINQFDFRPSIARTAEPSLSSTDAPINPVDSETFNQTDDKKFPVPDSLCTTSIEHYIGRIDDVYIGEKSNIFVLQGIPDENPRKRLVSNTPKNALKLQTISVPAYPNITKILSKNIAGIINTKIGNEKFVNNKLKNRIVIPLMNAKAQQTTQPMAYSMEDIGGLERRIADLEYYVSLSILETNITNKTIPSSVDPSINRFKFGFFADDFSSELYSSTTDPQYAASIESEGEDDSGQLASPINAATGAVDKSNPISTAGAFVSTIQQRATNRLVPPKTNWLLRHYSDNLPYIDYKIIEQITVTKRPVACVPDIQVTTTTVASKAYFFTQQTNSRGKEEKTDIITFGSKAGPVTLYFFNFSAGDEYFIFQGTNQISGSQVSFNQVSALTAADKNFLQTNPAAAGWYNLSRVPDLSRTFTRVSGNQNFVTNAGKISFNHNPANGLNYSIRVVKGSGSVVWKYLLEYPGESQASILTDVNKCGIFIDQPIFQGTIKVNNNVSWSCSAKFRINEDTYTAFTVECTGLKPNTFHDFLLEGVLYRDIIQNSKVVSNINLTNRLVLDPIANEVVAQTTVPKLLTNANGKLNFLVFVPLSYESWVVNELLTVGGVNSTGVTKQTLGSSGYSSLEVRDNTNSVAKIVIPNRLPTKILAQDPKGNV